MKRTRIIIAFVVSLALLFPGAAFADVDKCFKSVEKATTKITKALSGWDMATYAKKSKGLGTLLEKGWKKTAKCLDKNYKPAGKKKALKSALMRGKEAYNATGGEDWMGQGLINKCIPLALEAYEGTEKTAEKEGIDELSKKEKKKAMKKLIKNQKKVIAGTVGYCFKKENRAYKKRLKAYLKKHYKGK
jgi:hypothetical protein